VPAGDWPFFLFIALFATALPFALYVAAVGRLRGSVAMLLAMLEPVLAAALAWRCSPRRSRPRRSAARC
jgi:drug/metabolite transporter (DMT)-like permease